MPPARRRQLFAERRTAREIRGFLALSTSAVLANREPQARSQARLLTYHRPPAANPSSSGSAVGGSGRFRGLAHRVSVALGQGSELAQRERPRPTSLRDHDTCPQPYRTRRMDGLARTQPPARTSPAQGLGLVVRTRRPTIGVLRASAQRKRCGFASHTSGML